MKGVPAGGRSAKKVREEFRAARQTAPPDGARAGQGHATGSSAVAGPGKPLEELMAAVAKGDREAFAVLFEQVAPRIKGYLMGLGSDEDQAEEITQDVMVAVWRKAQMYDSSKAAASTWIFRIARNRRIDFWRRETRSELDPHEPGLHADGPQVPHEILDAAQQARGVRDAVAALPDDLAHVMRLAYFEGLTHTQIALKLGIPLGTIKSRIRKALEKVRKSLDP